MAENRLISISKADSDEKIGEFWDSHDFTEFDTDAPDADQSRIEELARKSTEGELTEDERAEYAGYVRANKFVAILRPQTQRYSF